MPLSSIKFAPGFDKQSTSYGAEGKWVDGENVRFRYGQPEKIGGWIKLTNDKLIGSARSMFGWTALDGTRYLAIGTDKKLYIYTEGSYFDVTPIRATESSLTNPFVTTSGSAVVTVTDVGHSARQGDFVTFTAASTVGGLDMNAEFEITAVTSSSVYTVTHSSNASSGATGGGSSTATYQIRVGQETNIYGYGWGVSTWNGFVIPTVTDAVNMGSGINSSATTLTVNDGSKFAVNDFIIVDQEIMKVTGKSTNDLTVVRGIAAVGSTTTTSAGSHVAAAHADDAVVTIITSSVGWGEGNPTSDTVLDNRYWVFDSFGEDLLALQSDGALYKWDTSAGTSTRAAVVHANAPTASRFLILSSPDRHIFLLGTETTAGDTSTQDDLFLRFSSQEDPSTWTPARTNSAGSFRIQDGSKIITAVRSRGAILVWTDKSLHSLNFVGQPFVFGLTQLAANCGAVSPNCAVDVNGTSFWMSQEAFFLFDGAVKKLPCSVQDHVFDDFNLTQQRLVFAGLNTDYNEITWFYASSGSNFIDRNVTFNYLEGTWYTNTLARTTWLDRGVYQVPYATEYEPTVVGDNPTVLGATDGATLIYSHEQGVDDEQGAMNCFVKSGDFDLQDGEQILSISRMIPDFKNQKGSANVLLSFSNYSGNSNTDKLNGAITSSATSITLDNASQFDSEGTILLGSEIITYTAKDVNNSNTLTGCSRGTNGTTAAAHVDGAVVTNYTNTRINRSTITPSTDKIDIRGRGRHGSVLISSNAVGDDWRFGTLRLDVKPDGGR